ncbi:MAG: stage III sporulation protein AF [Bacillota bacterium]|jgi:stage III sporulation protein AF
MIEIVGEIVRNVAILVILAVFFELLLPFGELSRFIRLVMGLLLLAAVLNPLLGFIGQEPVLAIYKEEDYSSQTTEILEKGQDISSRLAEQAQQEYQEGLCGQIASLAALTPGIMSAEATVKLGDEATVINNITVKAVKDGTVLDDYSLRKKIQSTLSNFYSIKESFIDVSFEEGGAKNDQGKGDSQ